MKYWTITRHIVSRYGLPEVRRRINSLDLAAIDLDDCIYPRNSHIELTKNMFLDLPYTYRHYTDLRHMFKLLRGFELFLFYITGKIFRTHLSNRFLLEEYEIAMRGMPMHYFEKCAIDLPRKVYTNSRETVELLADRMPTGIITVGFDMIVREFERQFNSGGTTVVSFIDANKAIFVEHKEEKLYDGFSREDAIITPKDKLRRLVRRMEEYGAGCPLVIGHRTDELAMARYARELGGLSIGFNPDIGIEKEFDIVVKARDWTPVRDLFQSSFSQQMKGRRQHEPEAREPGERTKSEA